MHDLDGLFKDLGPWVLGVLVRRGADFASGEDAVQEALLEASRSWVAHRPDDPFAWLVTTAWRKHLDAMRSQSARRRREVADHQEPVAGPVTGADETLLLLFLACHPALTPASAVALTLRAVGGLTTRQVATAYLVPESTMAQRISRAKRTLAQERLTEPGDLGVVLRVLYLIYNEGHTGEVDLAQEAIRLTRQLAASTSEPEVGGLLALMLLHHARRPARWASDGALVSLTDQDRARWDTTLIAEGVEIIQSALAQDRLGQYQAQAAIAALHADAPTADQTDWTQILEWYDELLRLHPTPVVELNRAVAVGEADGPLAGLAAVARVAETVPRHAAVRAHLHERAGDLVRAQALYAVAARAAGSVAERDHLTRQAARLHARPPQA
ncbi:MULTISPECIES: RNA polymerase sigma factor [unclassified Knoellia]|uniref:RNA polymerase sigma factor n=1 Tax=Knoellia altitudinis TaxID=3404795 RepID=UPI003622E4A6